VKTSEVLLNISFLENFGVSVIYMEKEELRLRQCRYFADKGREGVNFL